MERLVIKKLAEDMRRDNVSGDQYDVFDLVKVIKKVVSEKYGITFDICSDIVNQQRVYEAAIKYPGVTEKFVKELDEALYPACSRMAFNFTKDYADVLRRMIVRKNWDVVYANYQHITLKDMNY